MRACSTLIPVINRTPEFGQYVGWDVSGSSGSSISAIDHGLTSSAATVPLWANASSCAKPLPPYASAELRAAVRKVRLFEQFVRELQRVRLRGLPRKHLIVFFLNVYNAMVEHGLLRVAMPIDRRSLAAFRHAVVYRIGAFDYSLDTIYHVVFRGNERPADAWAARVSPSDPRAALNPKADRRAVLLRADAVLPLPPVEEVETYFARGASVLLDDAVSRFCRRHVTVDPRGAKLCLPRVFHESWNAFGSCDESAVRWLARFLAPLAEQPAGKWKVLWPDAAYGRG